MDTDLHGFREQLQVRESWCEAFACELSKMTRERAKGCAGSNRVKNVKGKGHGRRPNN